MGREKTTADLLRAIEEYAREHGIRIRTPQDATNVIEHMMAECGAL